MGTIEYTLMALAVLVVLAVMVTAGYFALLKHRRKLISENLPGALTHISQHYTIWSKELYSQYAFNQAKHVECGVNWFGPFSTYAHLLMPLVNMRTSKQFMACMPINISTASLLSVADLSKHIVNNLGLWSYHNSADDELHLRLLSMEDYTARHAVRLKLITAFEWILSISWDHVPGVKDSERGFWVFRDRAYFISNDKEYGMQISLRNGSRGVSVEEFLIAHKPELKEIDTVATNLVRAKMLLQNSSRGSETRETSIPDGAKLLLANTTVSGILSADPADTYTVIHRYPELEIPTLWMFDTNKFIDTYSYLIMHDATHRIALVDITKYYMAPECA